MARDGPAHRSIRRPLIEEEQKSRIRRPVGRILINLNYDEKVLIFISSGAPLSPWGRSVESIKHGAIGCSVAYHLTRRGERDVLLLEKSQLTNGCTWHAAGLVGQLRGRKNLTRLMQNSVAVLDRLEAESDQPIDWKKVGSLRLASSPDRWSEM